MFGYWHRWIVHILVQIRLNGIKSFLGELIYRNREAIIIMKELADDLIFISLPKNSGLACAEISQELLNDKNVFNKYKNRELRATHYLNKGYYGVGLLKGKEIVADMWCYSPSFSPTSSGPRDLSWLGISLQKNHAYAFDMFLNPQMRGHNLAAYLQGNFLLRLREKGIERIYGYYWADNIPALWVHRMLKWKELGRVKVDRFITIIKARASDTRQTSL